MKVYELILDEDTVGLNGIGFVEYPATEVDAFMFSKQKEIKCEFNILDDSERRIIGVIARANFKVYRRNANGEEFFVYFTPKTIRQMAARFINSGFLSNFDIEHDRDLTIGGVTTEQIFIKDSKKGIVPKGLEDLEDGSLIGVWQIHNDELWEAFKQGIVKSVSLEGLFKMKEEEKINSLDELLKSLS